MKKTKLWKQIETDKKDTVRMYKEGKKGIADTPKAKAYLKGEYDGLDRAQYLVEQSQKPTKHKKRKQHKVSDNLI